MRRFFHDPFVAFVAIVSVLVASILFVSSAPRRSPPDDLREMLAADLAEVHRVPQRIRVLGYSRERFGQGWGYQERDGVVCTSREHELREAFGEPLANSAGHAGGDRPECDKPPSHLSARDPYTGGTMHAGDVDVDHLVPLAAAWDLGAWAWDARQRSTFANDMEANLIVTSSAANREKSDATLSEWLPDVDRCPYAAGFVHVIVCYGLYLPEADAAIAREACGL